MKMKLFELNNEKYHMGHLVRDGLRTFPDTIFQIDGATGESETNASVLRRTVQFARCLLRFGVRPGDVLALSGRNHLDLHIPYYAALMIGMPVSGVDPEFKYTEIKVQYEILGYPKVAFCQKERLEDYLQAIRDLGLNTKLICFDDGEYSMKKFIQEYDDGCDDTEFEPLNFDLDQIYCWLLSTGGSTGVIKVAACKHRALFKKLMEFRPMMTSFPYDGELKNKPRDIENLAFEELPLSYRKNIENLRLLHLAPVHWISFAFGALTGPPMRVTNIMTSAPFISEHIIDIINEYKPLVTTMGPFVVASILKSKKQCDLSCFRSISIAGSKIPEKLLLQLRNRLRPDAIVNEVYGQTESLGPILSPNPSGPIGNCGHCPLEWQKNIKLVDPETGVEIKEPNVPGEMLTKITGFSGYYNNPEETKNAFTDDGWFRTGDILYRDEGGNYFFVERIKMLIKYRNYHIIPSEIETVILEHPGVSYVSVTSIPHEEDGEHPVACVVRKIGSNVTAQEIKDLVASKRSDSQHLRGGVVFLDEIPLTSTGKIARGKIKQIALTAQRE